MSHLHSWIKTLMGSLDSEVDEEVRIRLLENCGRNCIPRSFVEKVKELRKDSKDLDEFLDKLGEVWPHLERDGDEVYAVYDRCYCPLVEDHPDKLSRSFCYCSRGWLKELFESALKRPVEVELLKSIRQGDDTCRFRVVL